MKLQTKQKVEINVFNKEMRILRKTLTQFSKELIYVEQDGVIYSNLIQLFIQSDHNKIIISKWEISENDPTDGTNESFSNLSGLHFNVSELKQIVDLVLQHQDKVEIFDETEFGTVTEQDSYDLSNYTSVKWIEEYESAGKVEFENIL